MARDEPIRRVFAATLVSGVLLAACGGDDRGSSAAGDVSIAGTTVASADDGGSAGGSTRPDDGSGSDEAGDAGASSTSTSMSSTTTTTTEPPFEPEPLRIERRDGLDPEGRPWVPIDVAAIDGHLVTAETTSGFMPSVAVYEPETGELRSRQGLDAHRFHVAPSGSYVFDLVECSLRSIAVDATSGAAVFGEPLERVGDGRSCIGQDQLQRGDQVWVPQRRELAVFDLAVSAVARVALPFDLAVADVEGASISIWPPVDVGDGVLVGVSTGREDPDLLVRVEENLTVSTTRVVDGRVRVQDGRIGVEPSDTMVWTPVDPVTLEAAEQEPDDGAEMPPVCEFGPVWPGVDGRSWLGPTYDTDGTPTWRLCVDDEWIAEGATDADLSVIDAIEVDGRLHVLGTDASVDGDPPAVWLVISPA